MEGDLGCWRIRGCIHCVLELVVRPFRPRNNGQTGRELGEKTNEHRMWWRRSHLNTAFGSHGNCQPRFDDVDILAREPHDGLRLLTESSFIRAIGARETVIISPNELTLNRTAGTRIDDRWVPVLHLAERGERTGERAAVQGAGAWWDKGRQGLGKLVRQTNGWKRESPVK